MLFLVVQGLLYTFLLFLDIIMRSQNKNPKTTSRMSYSKRGAGQRAGDVDSALLQKISGKLGNDTLQDQIKQRGNSRDQLLSFIIQHLKKIQSVQKIELDEMKNRERWFREVSKGEAGFHLPDATRWHEAAKLFKRAAQAMCKGDLSRGKELLEQAMEQEKAAYDSLPKMVLDRLNTVDQSGGNAPVELTRNGAEVCPSTRLPQEIAIADQIINIRATMDKMPPLRKTRPFNWWDTLEEEEEEDNETQEQQENEEEDLLEKENTAELQKESSQTGKEE